MANTIIAEKEVDKQELQNSDVKIADYTGKCDLCKKNDGWKRDKSVVGLEGFRCVYCGCFVMT